MAVKKTLRVCPKGHKFYKSTDCPTCPHCEAEKKPQTGFKALMGAPARRALENKGINTLKQLSKYTEKEILSIHGMGPASMPLLKEHLKKAGLSFKE